MRGGSRTTSGRAPSATSSRTTSGRATNAQVVVEQVQKPISSTEVQEKAYVVNQRENDMRNVLHTPPTYTVPPLALLSIPQQSALDNTEWLEEQKELLDTTFNNFHVGAHVINVSQGPAVTRFEVQPHQV